MNRDKTLHRLKFLWDQVHQTEERMEHLPASLPLDVHPESLNYPEDLARIKAEYNWLAKSALQDQTLTEGDLAAEQLPREFTQH